MFPVIPNSTSATTSSSSSTSGYVESRPLGLGALMISSLGRMTLGSLGFGSSLEYRLPPLHTTARGQLVQVKENSKWQEACHLEPNRSHEASLEPSRSHDSSPELVILRTLI